MSICAHRQYCFLRKLPHCPKCKSQLTTVFARYENGSEQWEWECLKCSRVFPLSSFEDKKDEFELFLNNKYARDSRPKKKEKRRKRRWNKTYKANK